MTFESMDQLTTASDDLSPVGAAGGGAVTDDPPSDNTCTTTWARDSHELFDYEARHVHKRSYFLRRAARVFRTTLDVQVVPEGSPLPTQAADYLLSIRHRDGRFIVVPADKNIQTTGSTAILPKKIWLVVKDLPTGSHYLREGDVMKLGRFKLRVKQLVKAGPTIPELRLDDADTPHSAVTPEETLTMQCRICLLDGGTVEDPLVCPCQCKGSIKYVHLDCLRHWINGRLSLSVDWKLLLLHIKKLQEDDQQQKMSFFFKQLQCELCKTPFPSALILNNERVPIVKVPKIEAPFIILENIVGTANRGLHVISMETKKELKLGRGHESDVRIADVSISRYHATIRFCDGEFVLEDHNSKFGTLVSLRKFQPVESSHTLAVQVGRTILNLSLRRPPCPFEDVLAVNDEGPVTSGSAADLGGGTGLDNGYGHLPPAADTSYNACDAAAYGSGYSHHATGGPREEFSAVTSAPAEHAPPVLGLMQQRDLYDRLATAIMAARESGMDLAELFEDGSHYALERSAPSSPPRHVPRHNSLCSGRLSDQCGHSDHRPSETGVPLQPFDPQPYWNYAAGDANRLASEALNGNSSYHHCLEVSGVTSQAIVPPSSGYLETDECAEVTTRTTAAGPSSLRSQDHHPVSATADGGQLDDAVCCGDSQHLPPTVPPCYATRHTRSSRNLVSVAAAMAPAATAAVYDLQDQHPSAWSAGAGTASSSRDPCPDWRTSSEARASRGNEAPKGDDGARQPSVESSSDAAWPPGHHDRASFRRDHDDDYRTLRFHL